MDYAIEHIIRHFRNRHGVDVMEIPFDDARQLCHDHAYELEDMAGFYSTCEYMGIKPNATMAEEFISMERRIRGLSKFTTTGHKLLKALRLAVHALNVHERFGVGDTDSYAIAAECDNAIAEAEGSSER